jgi:putative membrane protein
MMTGIGMGLGGIGLLFMLLFWGGLIFGGVWLVKTIFTSGQQTPSGMASMEQTSPRDILDQRYARGEISKDEYDQIKNDLT